MIFLATGINTAIIATQDELKGNFDFIANTFEGTGKDFLMANMLNTAKNNSIYISPANIERFNKLCKDEGYKNIIAQKLKGKSENNDFNGNDKLLATDGKIINKLDLNILKNKGKVIILYFWANRCTPCREEMPYARRLKKKYQGKEIVFINLSIDDEINKWLKANKEEGLIDEYSFLILNAKQSPSIKEYNINTIPRYILIDERGKVVIENAPRSSEKALLSKIDDLLFN